MARNGNPKPHRKTPLGASFVRFTCDSSSSKDQGFTKKIKKLRPDWFLHKLIQVADKKKQTLLNMAREGKRKPDHRTPLGRALGHYTQESSNSRDPKFTSEIKKIRPDWFVDQSDIAGQKKKILLGMANARKPKPNNKLAICKALYCYTQKSSSSYDPVFTKQIKRLAPHWFKRCSTR